MRTRSGEKRVEEVESVEEEVRKISKDEVRKKFEVEEE